MRVPHAARRAPPALGLCAAVLPGRRQVRVAAQRAFAGLGDGGAGFETGLATGLATGCDVGAGFAFGLLTGFGFGFGLDFALFGLFISSYFSTNSLTCGSVADLPSIFHFDVPL